VAGGLTERGCPDMRPNSHQQFRARCPRPEASGQCSDLWIHVLCTAHKSGRITSTHWSLAHRPQNERWVLGRASCHSCAVHFGVGFNTSSAIHRPQNRSSLILHVQQQHKVGTATRCNRLPSPHTSLPSWSTTPDNLHQFAPPSSRPLASPTSAKTFLRHWPRWRRWA
jgi:hypothetical protein